MTSPTGWTDAEDELLLVAIELFNKCSWRKVAAHAFPGGSRTAVDCEARWKGLSQPHANKGPWSADEDARLSDLVTVHGTTKWTLIASKLGTRLGKQCRERWQNHLRPGIDRSPFRPEEDDKIIALYGTFGPKWAKMSKQMPSRPENSIKNRWNTTLHRRYDRKQDKSCHSSGSVSPSAARRISRRVAAERRHQPYKATPTRSRRKEGRSRKADWSSSSSPAPSSSSTSCSSPISPSDAESVNSVDEDVAGVEGDEAIEDVEDVEDVDGNETHCSRSPSPSPEHHNSEQCLPSIHELLIYPSRTPPAENPAICSETLCYDYGSEQPPLESFHNLFALAEACERAQRGEEVNGHDDENDESSRNVMSISVICDL